MSAQERSASRGRDAFKSTGRGGAGNMQPTSHSRDARPDLGPSDFSTPRGREPVAKPAAKVYTTGRGGAGNLQYSAQAPRPESSFTETEREVIKEHVNAQESANFSSGRGGLGNFANRSRSREPASTPNVYSSGRGGVGNIQYGEAAPIGVIDEEERQKQNASHKPETYRSTGRGGSANFQVGQEPKIEHPPVTNPQYESTGRGGAGNIVHNERARSHSRRRE
ncbi:hypothetical protein HYPSUDRAFT_207405 [Hypholoma sublateritium FD-334 SS-4]|uniref:Uncharacterized protein n=1 Tax=Hypholoma sublateritium (strain FD-334 SS-4) TaxID=945553 RepID=A0A0D2LYN8_HYPSF|nr:hypothetical protein HYPSUDRAFT_207405 [Hypholoma sublateritium FD-334 SS-4]